LIRPAGPKTMHRHFQHFCSATFGPGLRLRDFPHRNSAALSIANNVGRAPPPPTHACAPPARHNGVCPAQTRPPADTAHVSRWLRKGPAIRHHGLRSLVAAERAVPLQSSLTVSCSSHQGASACSDGAAVRCAAAPGVVVLFVVLLVLVVAVCCCCCAIPAASPCVRPASLYHLDRYILGGARACGCAILAGGPTSRLEAVARA
jgi:hypothetical protein